MPPALIGVWPFKQLEIHPGVLARRPCPTLPQAAEAGTGVPRQQWRAGGSPVPWGTSPLPASVGAQAQGPVPSPGGPQPTPAGCPGTLGSPASPRPPDPRRLRTWGPHRQAREPGAKPRGGFPCQPLLGASMWKHSPQNRFLEQGPGALSLRRGRLQPRLPRAAPPGANRGPFPLSRQRGAGAGTRRRGQGGRLVPRPPFVGPKRLFQAHECVPAVGPRLVCGAWWAEAWPAGPGAPAGNVAQPPPLVHPSPAGCPDSALGQD